MTLLKKINFYFLIFCGFNCYPQGDVAQQTVYDIKMMKSIDDYIMSYSPLYHYKGDTFLVARFRPVPDEINQYLIKCASIGNLKPLKYAAALIIRHNFEYQKVNKSDYLIGDGMILFKNGFIEMLRKSMRIESSDDMDSPDYFPFYTGEVCKWIKDHKDSIDDFKFVEKYKKQCYKKYDER